MARNAYSATYASPSRDSRGEAIQERSARTPRKPCGASRAERFCARRRNANSGFTLVELMVVLVVAGIIIRIGIPSFQRAMQRSRADVACANLRSIWAAQRLYWLESQCFANDPSVLQSAGLLDSNLKFNDSSGPYLYTLTAGSSTFTTTAVPTASFCSGKFTITESGGTIDGTVSFSGWTIGPTSFW